MRRLTGLVATMGFIIALVSVTGCSSDSTDPDGNGNGNQTTFSGTIAGTFWTAVTPLAARSGTSTVSVSVFGTDAQDRYISVTVAGITGPGVYQAGPAQPALVTLELGSQVWPGFLAGTTGTVTINTLTATYMIGSFSVNLQPLTSTGATGTRAVAGQFTAYFGQT